MERKNTFKGESAYIFGDLGRRGKYFQGADEFLSSMHYFQGSREHRPRGGGGLEDENIFYCVALLCSVRQLNIIIKESFTTLHEPRFSAHDKSRKFHGFTENLFYMKWAASFVIFLNICAYFNLKTSFFQFYQRKVPCFSSIREINHYFSVTSSVSQ